MQGRKRPFHSSDSGNWQLHEGEGSVGTENTKLLFAEG